MWKEDFEDTIFEKKDGHGFTQGHEVVMRCPGLRCSMGSSLITTKTKAVELLQTLITSTAILVGKPKS